MTMTAPHPIPLHPARDHAWRKPVLAAAVVAVLAGGAWFALQRAPAPATPASATKVAEKPPVLELGSADVAAISARSLALSLPLSGSLAPLSSATIKSKVSGVVQATTVQEGMAVAAGQVLARIDQADLRARLQQQHAQLDEAQARLAMATKNEANSGALLAQKYISQNAYDSTQNSVELARAAVKSAQAMVEIARIALEDGVIRAPIAGVVSKRHVQAGEKLAPDMPVFSIVNLAELTLEAQVPASEIPRVRVGQDVRFRVDGYQQREFTGKVARINPSTEAGSRALLVYIAVRNVDAALRAGMFAKGAIVTDRADVAPVVPLAALRDDHGRQVVYRVDDGKVVAQPVTLGLRNDDEGTAQVVAGLQDGARVIVSKLPALKPGAQVSLPAEAASTAAAATAAASQPKKG
ncbi:UNVERIFIED_ORG: RND family efflux transporter MFP subunit [Zoogloea ramigera]|uniref:Efflux RND transporter periplasmic adaptor subunit n=1 Tax=Duganella zoogloeoides TaxID=75659 RepID=A0ABZ0XZW0_9BURK|nr:efflux RND transporter periplasmic adaptor subunit [Duganella zoogloeoides]WQH05310.1 efflux RND transporter periplasmic adaptor subunit [Duganella zoogloeoides]